MTVDRREVQVAGTVSDDAVIAAIQLAGYEVAQVSWPSTMAWTGKDPYCRLGGIR